MISVVLVAHHRPLQAVQPVSQGLATPGKEGVWNRPGIPPADAGRLEAGSDQPTHGPAAVDPRRMGKEPAAVVLADQRSHRDLDSGLFPHLAKQGGLIALAVLEIAAGELPASRLHAHRQQNARLREDDALHDHQGRARRAEAP